MNWHTKKTSNVQYFIKLLKMAPTKIVHIIIYYYIYQTLFIIWFLDSHYYVFIKLKKKNQIHFSEMVKNCSNNSKFAKRTIVDGLSIVKCKKQSSFGIEVYCSVLYEPSNDETSFFMSILGIHFTKCYPNIATTWTGETTVPFREMYTKVVHMDYNSMWIRHIDLQIIVEFFVDLLDIIIKFFLNIYFTTIRSRS